MKGYGRTRMDFWDWPTEQYKNAKNKARREGKAEAEQQRLEGEMYFNEPEPCGPECPLCSSTQPID